MGAEDMADGLSICPRKSPREAGVGEGRGGGGAGGDEGPLTCKCSCDNPAGRLRASGRPRLGQSISIFYM